MVELHVSFFRYVECFGGAARGSELESCTAEYVSKGKDWTRMQERNLWLSYQRCCLLSLAKTAVDAALPLGKSMSEKDMGLRRG